MADVRIPWTEPVTRADGSALPAAEIRGTEITVRRGTTIVSGPTVVLRGATQVVNLTSLPDGDYVATGVTIDTGSRRSAAATVPFTIRTIANPSAPAFGTITVV